MARLAGCILLVASPPGRAAEANVAITNYQARGVIRELEGDGLTAIIQHEAISNYMGAMTMPFKVREPADLAGMTVGDRITFRLRVTDDESWIDHIVKDSTAPAAMKDPASARLSPATSGKAGGARDDASAIQPRPHHPLLDYKFTNELNQAVSLGQFQGQALALTFFFTRCPTPNFCPRLSRNFQEVEQKLEAMPDAPTNWHLISVTFDPMNDTPEVLKNYAGMYHYDPAHWSFLTGPTDKIAELARLCDVQYSPESGLINHNFRTLIINATNHLQMVFPTSGDLSDQIVEEMLKAAASTNQIPGNKIAASNLVPK